MEVVSISDGRTRRGLRLVTRKGVPTPWAQAAKGIIELKGLPCILAQESESDPKGAQVDWVGGQGAPYVAYDDEPVREGWAEILELAERLAPMPSLIPADGPDRALMYGLAHEICGEMGLGWCLRLVMIHRSLAEPDAPGAFPERLARYLGHKYGYHPACASRAPSRVRTVLDTLQQALGAQTYFFGETVTALDVYWAAFANMFLLLDETELPAVPLARDAWAGGGGRFRDEVPDNLRRHHRRMYALHLGLPVQL